VRREELEEETFVGKEIIRLRKKDIWLFNGDIFSTVNERAGEGDKSKARGTRRPSGPLGILGGPTILESIIRHEATERSERRKKTYLIGGEGGSTEKGSWQKNHREGL